MKHFHDLSEKNDVTEVRSPVDFQDIKTSDSLTKEQAVDFWDSEFNAPSERHDGEHLDEESLLTEIFDRDESEFEFDFEIDDDIQAVLDKFDSDKWETLSETEREAIVVELVSATGGKLGLDEIPAVKFFEGPENQCGAFNQKENTIEINRNIFSDPKEVVNTTAHEVRHAYQYQRALANETYVDRLYKVNFDNYISPIMQDDGSYLFFTDYQDQYVEAEARAFANLFEKEVAS